ncbi:MAG: 2-amino-4-hydroxy-6-hydroxymethyldihydropteridine diphosphokinase [Magnetococcus sp. THC-1_WYH]
MAGQLPVLIAFGANIDPLDNLVRGLGLLHQEIGIHRVSTVWRTCALSDPDQTSDDGENPDYLNGVVQLSHRVGNWHPLQLRRCLRGIEHRCGRTRESRRYAARTLDLDIAMMGSMVFAADGLILPDPDVLSRPFIALPCAQLAPDLVHPHTNQTLATLASTWPECSEAMAADDVASRMLASISLQDSWCPLRPGSLLG